MATPKTQEEIDAEIAALKALVGRIIPRAMFGDDNNAALQVVIGVLQDGKTARDIEDEYGDEDDGDERLYEAAMQAVDWRAGYATDTPSEDWASLLRK